MPVNPTLKDIASRVGVSVPTVSRALAGYQDIALETRQFIKQIAKEMNYRPNVHARNLVTKTATIQNILILGVPTVLRSIAFNSYYAEIMRALSDTIDTALHRFILSVEDESSDDFVDYHKVIRDHAASAASESCAGRLR